MTGRSRFRLLAVIVVAAVSSSAATALIIGTPATGGTNDSAYLRQIRSNTANLQAIAQDARRLSTNSDVLRTINSNVVNGFTELDVQIRRLRTDQAQTCRAIAGAGANCPYGSP